MDQYMKDFVLTNESKNHCPLISESNKFLKALHCADCCMPKICIYSATLK